MTKNSGKIDPKGSLLETLLNATNILIKMNAPYSMFEEIFRRILEEDNERE